MKKPMKWKGSGADKKADAKGMAAMLRKQKSAKGAATKMKAKAK